MVHPGPPGATGSRPGAGLGWGRWLQPLPRGAGLCRPAGARARPYMGTGGFSSARRTPARTLPAAPREPGQDTLRAASVIPNPGAKRAAGEADLSQTGSGEHRVTPGVLALVCRCQAAPSPGVSGHGPGRGAEGPRSRSGAEERSPCPRPRPPAVPGAPSAARGAHRGGGRGDAGGRCLAATWPPQGCRPAKATNPAPHDPPVTAGCGGAAGTHMSQERRGTRRGAKAGLARCIPFVPLPWTGASGEFVQALGSAHPGSLHGNAGAM